MDTNGAILILERWIARTAESYPRYAAALLSKEPDPFRNPVGATLRRSLSQLLRELFGEMDAPAIASAIDPIIRLLVVQGFANDALPPDDAVRFVSLLKPILRELASERNSAVLDGMIDDGTIDERRIDRLATMAADKYTECRAQLDRIRAHEVQRASHVQQLIRASRSA
jgi:hypothetical protein